jgi:hypothetical protein
MPGDKDTIFLVSIVLLVVMAIVAVVILYKAWDEEDDE